MKERERDLRIFAEEGSNLDFAAMSMSTEDERKSNCRSICLLLIAFESAMEMKLEDKNKQIMEYL